MSEATLIRHRRIWSEKPVLRTLYADWYRDIVSQLVPGRTLEVGFFRLKAL